MRKATLNKATADFWGWHATANENGKRDAVVGKVTVSATSPSPQCSPLTNCPAPYYLYGPWSYAPKVCTFPHKINMSFELLTIDLQTPPKCK